MVITDLTMPGISGIDLSMKIKKVRPDMPIILCTGFSAQATEEKARAIGIGMVLRKPVSKSVLAHAVRNVLDRE